MFIKLYKFYQNRVVHIFYKKYCHEIMTKKEYKKLICFFMKIVIKFIFLQK